jgi:hypothetical protein
MFVPACSRRSILLSARGFARCFDTFQLRL